MGEAARGPGGLLPAGSHDGPEEDKVEDKVERDRTRFTIRFRST